VCVCVCVWCMRVDVYTCMYMGLVYRIDTALLQ